MSDAKRMLTLDDGRYVVVLNNGQCGLYFPDGLFIRNLDRGHLEGALAYALSRYELAALPKEPEEVTLIRNIMCGSGVLSRERVAIDYIDKLRAQLAKVTAELNKANKIIDGLCEQNRKEEEKLRPLIEKAGCDPDHHSADIAIKELLFRATTAEAELAAARKLLEEAREVIAKRDVREGV